MHMSPFAFAHPSAQTVVALAALSPSTALAQGHPARARIAETSKSLQSESLNLSRISQSEHF